MAVLLFSIPFVVSALGEEEDAVRAYFADIPVMANIAQCESKFTQFGKGGAALQGGMGGKMVGIFQVYGDIHAAYAKERGMDIETIDGNLAYARYLYEHEGTTPWNSSSSCWGDMVVATSTPRIIVAQANPLGDAPHIVNEIIPPFTRNLSIGTEHEEVRTLQRFLNGAGYMLAASGEGSRGNETARFGALTRSALRRFQCGKGIVCDGDEASTGYGYFGPRTRAALLATPQNLTTLMPINPAATSTVSVSNTSDAEVARLQAQIVELTKMLAVLMRGR